MPRTPANGLSWMELAACQAMEPELFFPLSAAGPAVAQAAVAKAVCRGCPVRAQCLSYALQTGQQHGVWGGTTEEERRLARHGQVTPLAG